MKKQKLTIKMISVAVGLIFMLAFARDDYWVRKNDSTLYYTTSLSVNSSFVPNSITFSGANDSGEIVITFGDSIDVSYAGNLTDAAKTFFEFVESYIENNYYIIPIDSTILIDPRKSEQFKWICIKN